MYSGMCQFLILQQKKGSLIAHLHCTLQRWSHIVTSFLISSQSQSHALVSFQYCSVTTHTAVLDGAKEMLLQRIQSLPTEKLLELLDKCFPYMSVTELQPVPMAILQRLDAVPAYFLKPLAENKEIFGRLPLHVQRQVSTPLDCVIFTVN